MERNNRLFANDPDQGIFVFDPFGQYLYTLEVLGLDYFQIFSNRLIYYENHTLKSWGLQSKLEQLIIEWKNNEEVQQIIFNQKGQFYIRKKESIEVWQMSDKLRK